MPNLLEIASGRTYPGFEDLNPSPWNGIAFRFQPLARVPDEQLGVTDLRLPGRAFKFITRQDIDELMKSLMTKFCLQQ